MKSNTAPGPDGLTADVLKVLDSANIDGLTSMFNTWWMEEKIPSELTRAEVVLIHKKGSTADLGKYRPISLLNALYKVFAVLIKKRIEG
eukprot:5349459-Alexandrium_andersonii.AAC.1